MKIKGQMNPPSRPAATSWWLDADRFYDRAKREAERMHGSREEQTTPTKGVPRQV